MIFNINSTGGQTRFLTCAARVTCLVLILLSHSSNCIGLQSHVQRRSISDVELPMGFESANSVPKLFKF